MNHLRLHTESNRADIFAGARDSPMAFDKALGAWIVLDPTAITAILRDSRIVACTIVDAFSLIDARYGVKLPNLAAAAKFLPLGLEGRPHQAVRRQMARLLSNAQERLNERMPQMVERHFAPVARSAEAELVSECAAPFVEELFSQILGTAEIIPYRRRTIGRIFDRFASVTTHIRIDAELATLREQLVANGIEDADLALAFLMIGRDSLVSTLSESLAEIARNSGDRRLTDQILPTAPPQTGVSVTERMVTEDMSLGDQELRKGDRLRLYFQGYGYRPAEADRLLMFGTGLHSCLGRGVSLDAWQALVAWLGDVPRHMELADYAVCPDPIFTMPEYVRVRLN